MSDHTPAPAHPAATVVLLQDGDDRCEVLLVRRSKRLSFHGGAWVFPGGRIDRDDYAPGTGGDVLAAARQAAVREAREEVGLVIASEDLVPISRWITPEVLPKRFDTWFFAAAAGSEQVEVDGTEIREHRWISLDAALAAQREGEIELPPPTFVTILGLSRYRRVADTLAALASSSVETFFPRVATLEGGACTLYQGDAGYHDGDLSRPGPRHRLLMLPSGWRYERDM
jgi:8-oxo-dGTP pyrophosphatase MutT (NUDIX family)